MKCKISLSPILLLSIMFFLNVDGMEIQKETEELFDITTKICELPVEIIVNHIIPFILPLDNQTLILRFLLKDIEKGEQKDGVSSSYAKYKSTIKKWIDLFPEKKRGGMRLFRLLEGDLDEIRKAYPELKDLFDYEKRKALVEEEIKNGADLDIIITRKFRGLSVGFSMSLLGYSAKSRGKDIDTQFNKYMMKLLLKSGADRELYTPLVEAINHANLTAVQILINAGANVDVQWKGYAALNYCIKTINSCAYYPQSSTEGQNVFAIFELLLKSGANINVQNKAEGNTPLMTAAAGYYLGGKILHVIKELLVHGADVTLVNKKGESAADLLGSRLKELQGKNPGEPLYQEILDLLEQAEHNAGKKYEMQE